MSKMIPRETIDTLRHQVDVSLENYGIVCQLYIPTDVSYAASERKDVFATPDDLTYKSYTANVSIEWSVSTYRLKQLGIYTEDMLPILAWFPNIAIAKDGSEAGLEVAIDVIRRSYITVTPEFIPNDYVGVEAFEVVNPVIRGMHDAILVQGWSIVPRRVEKGA